MARKRVAILYVGGSIGMVTNRRTGRIEPVESLSEIHRVLPEIQREVQLSFHAVSNLGSSEVTPALWKEISLLIKRLYQDVDGFVVVHGTNTMSYTAAALAFSLQSLSKPIILTGSLLPIDDLGSDARTNLVFAIKAALLDIAEVCIVLGPRVLRGVRAKKAEQSILQTFESPKFPSLAEFNTAVELHDWRTVRRKRALSVRPDFDPNVVSIMLHPGMPMTHFDAILKMRPHGIVLRAYGPGMLPEHLFPWIENLSEAKVPLVITSQLLRGSIDLHLYRKQIALEKLHVFSGKDMTYDAAVVKLMWCLGLTRNVPAIRRLMEKDLVGELTE